MKIAHSLTLLKMKKVILLTPTWLIKSFSISLLLSSFQSFAEPESAFLLQDPLFIEKKNIGKSFPNVWKVLQDQDGFIWFTSPQALFRFDGHRTISYQYNEKSSQGLSGHPGRALLEDKDGILWVSTRGGGLNRFDPMTEKFQSIKKSNAPNSLSNNIVSKLTLGEADILWVGTRQGLNKIDLKTNISKRIKLLSPINDQPEKLFIRAIFEDSNKNLWIGTTNHGLFVINNKEIVVKRYSLSEKEQNRLSHNTVLSILEDNKGDIWIGTRKGIDRVNANGSISHYLNNKVSGNESTNNYIATLTKDSEGRIWAGSWYYGLFLFEKNNDNFRPISVDDSYSSMSIYDIYQDASGMLWVGSDKGLYVTNPASLSMVQIKHNSDALVLPFVFEDSAGGIWLKGKDGLYYSDAMSEDISHTEHKITINDEVFSMAEDVHGVLWIGTSSGLRRYTPKDKIVNCRVSSSNCTQFFADTQVWFIAAQKDNILWLGLENRVSKNNNYAGLVRFNTMSGQYEQFEAQHSVNDAVNMNTEQLLFVGNSGGLGLVNKQTKEISTIYPFDIKNKTEFNRVIKAEKDSYWLATEGDGLIKYNIDSKKIEFISKTVLPDQQEVLSMSFDPHGNIWVALPLSLAMITDDLNTAYQYDDAMGIRTQGYTRRKIITTQSGQIITGGIRGYLQFDPLKLAALRPKSKTKLTNFKLINKQVPITSAYSQTVLKHPIHNTHELTLSHQDYLFSIQFSSLDYSFSDRTRYAYKLQGLDKEWLTTSDNINEAVYSTLPSGDYRFRVKINSDSVLPAEETLLKIKILPPWWRTWWANSFYILSISIIVFLLFWSFYRRKITKNAINSALELAHTKENIFANLSHEFRTPLTLILGPSASIKKLAQDKKTKSDITLIERNAQRLLSMVDQILDLARLRGEQVQAHQRQDVTAIIGFLSHSFQTLADEKQIELCIDDKANDDLYVSMVPDALTKILTNLLSNAFKYALFGGNITLYIEKESHNFVVLSIKDTGRGMSQDELSFIFERFTRLEKTEDLVSGTGIGLALVKELVETHGGTIAVTSELDVGSTFTVRLPLIQYQGEASKPMSVVAKNYIDETIENLQLGKPVELHLDELTDEEGDHNKLSVLIIEDNLDMQRYLVDILLSRYQCLTAANGAEGFEKAKETVPDIIISDVMMPNMNGYEVANALKSNESTSHIPIVLLTAKGDKESRIRGWQENIDEYLTKPFDSEELMVRVANILSIRELLRQRLSAQIIYSHNNEPTNEEPETDLNARERQFIERLKKSLEHHYTDAEFSVSHLANAVSLSERQMHRKLKALLNITSANYIRVFRLKKAAALLRAGIAPSEVAHLAGFKSHAHFSRCFKAHFGSSPSNYVL